MVERTDTMAKQDTYETVTAAIITALEAGTRPWQATWSNGQGGAVMPRRVTGESYRGINVLLLWAAANQNGYGAAHWMTFNQALELGGAVRKGEKSTQIIFFKQLSIEKENAAGELEQHKLPMIRTYNVFNVQQIDGLPARFYPAPVAIVAGKERDQAAETALRSCGADIREGGGKAFYVPAHDYVQMPDLCHWSGHKSRLGRDLQNAFGSKDYAFEELVAEIGAAFVGARLGIVGEHIENHAAYIASWLKALKNDKRAIFRAATLAQAAADLVLANADQLAAPVPIAAAAVPVEVAQLALAI